MSRRHAGELRALFTSDDRTRHVEVLEKLPAIERGAVTIIPGDCLLTPTTLERVAMARLDGRPLLLGSAGAAAIASCHPEALADVDGALAEDDLERVWSALERRGAQMIALDGEVCVRVTDAPLVTAAEQALCRRLRADTAASDGPLAHWIDRRLSLRLSRWLVRHTRLGPNQITTIGTAIGLAGATLFALGTYWAGVLGSLLFLCATILDGCDGEVARLTFRESSFGQKFDVITDNVVHVAVFAGLAVGLYRQHEAGHYVALTALLLGGFACTLVATYFFLVRRPGFARSPIPPRSLKGRIRQRLLRGFEALMNRDFAYLLVVLALIGRLEWFVWGAAIGTYLFVIALVWVYRWRDAA